MGTAVRSRLMMLSGLRKCPRPNIWTWPSFTTLNSDHDQRQHDVDVELLDGRRPRQASERSQRHVLRAFISFPPVQGEALGQNGDEGDDALEGELPVRREQQPGGRRGHHRQDDRAHEHAQHRAESARDAHPAQQGDHQRVELVARRPAGHPGLELGGQQDAGDAGQQGAGQVQQGEVPGHLDPGEPGRLGVGADEVGAPAGDRHLLEDEGRDHQGDHDQHRDLDGGAPDGGVAQDPEDVRQAGVALGAAGDDLGHAAGQHHRAQGDDDGRHLEAGDEEGVDRPDAHGAQQRQRPGPRRTAGRGRWPARSGTRWRPGRNRRTARRSGR